MADSDRDSQGNICSDFKADAARYPKRPWLREQSFWAVALYRFGRWNDARRDGVEKRILDRFYWLAYRIVETATGITLPKNARIGPGLRVYHFGGIIIHPATVMGANCTLRQGVTIGNRYYDGPVPTIGDDVEFGAYAQVLGGISIGNRAKIGAMSLVMCDVPDDATAVGVPARVLQRQKTDCVDNRKRKV